MSTSEQQKEPMRISLTYLVPLLLLLLLLIVAVQPARAQNSDTQNSDTSSPCMAGPHSLFKGERGSYRGQSNATAAQYAQDARDYLNNMHDYNPERADYKTAAHAKAAEYAAAQNVYYAQSNDTALAYRTAGAAHQAKTVQTHQDYMSAGCPRADKVGARD